MLVEALRIDVEHADLEGGVAPVEAQASPVVADHLGALPRQAGKPPAQRRRLPRGREPRDGRDDFRQFRPVRLQVVDPEPVPPGAGVQEEPRAVDGLHPPVLEHEDPLFRLAQVNRVAADLDLLAALLPHPEAHGDVLVEKLLFLVGLEGLVGEKEDRVGRVLDDPRRGVVQEELEPVSDLGVGLGHDEPRRHAVPAVAHHGVEADELLLAEALHGLPGQALLGLAEGVVDAVAGMRGRAAHRLRVRRDGADLCLDHALVTEGDPLELLEGAPLGEALVLLGVVVDPDGGLLEIVHGPFLPGVGGHGRFAR